MKKSKFYLFTAIALSLALVLSACGAGSDKKSSSNGDSGSKNDQVLNMIETAEIPTGDPTLATDAASFSVFGQTLEGLYTLNDKDVPVPALAEGKPTISEDGKVYTFKIRKDAKWSNGDPVTAKDFVFSWRRAVDPKTGAQYAYMFAGVVKNATEIMGGKAKPDQLGVEAVDDNTLKVTLENAVPYLDSLLAFATFAPLNEKFVTEKGDKFGTNSDNMLSNGPFELKDWDGTGLTWKYVKNENYYDKANVKLKEVHVQVAKTPNTAINLYNTGKTDITAALSAEYAKQYQNNKDALKMVESSSWYLKFNQVRNGKKTPLANENIRKGLAMAFDKKAYTDTILSNGSFPSNGLVPKGVAKSPTDGKDFRDASGDLLTTDTAKAKEYWEKGLKELGVKSLTLELLSDDTENAKKTSEYFQDQLQKNLPGLTLKLTNVPFKIRIQKQDKQDYEIQMAGWGADYLDAMTYLDLFVTDGGNNKTGYSNKKYDQLINDAKVKYGNDLEKRWETLLQAEKILVQEDAAIAPIYQRGHLKLVKPYVKGFEEHLFGPDYTLKNVTIEK
ncbi:peptide ABC transporter substrate-binding protein [Heyndrickxia sporothermodurans]|uniref:Peptide ABC transporter substrate-binding protein n=1 Tax=Heyndrickxia sporothermodurans TaxID=46224 RepID=A0AB37HC35_9BACI|nr:peptide ABC transporter substrate-binding protein [Heyndrickxia sporothermodurans]MBL5803528.1 peptide ABC transporter substrate-binding protein [Heyndrickxia sporothermodurans]MBL5853254.1 peptide ABC transporter substrate-binding protein [Heyndrickxia sporothermodurans]MBL7246914.1 peptide ABC transporter substrate-binding protein [Heyndrickxia sporothermodurans]PTY83556.1 peptide ABC transporter substrate-binding protein [Heyndrickxia sporothermodurans]PTY92346.1 peptide ABC transporter 